MVAIYTLCDPATGEVRYVGMSRRVHARLRQYQSANGGHTPHLRHWLAVIGRLPILIVLAEVEEVDADVQERYWIAELRRSGARLLNYTDGGEGRFKWPEEHLARLREWRKAEVVAGTHNFLRADVRAKVLAAAKRRRGIPQPWSAATITAWNRSLKGIPLTVEQRRRVSESLRGRKCPWAATSEARERARHRWDDPVYRAQRLASSQKGGANPAGRIASAEKRRGVPLTPEHRQKVSAGSKAAWTPERRAVASARRKGKLVHPMTPAMRAKVSASLKEYFRRRREEQVEKVG